jgi:hypothetical protein
MDATGPEKPNNAAAVPVQTPGRGVRRRHGWLVVAQGGGKGRFGLSPSALESQHLGGPNEGL